MQRSAAIIDTFYLTQILLLSGAHVRFQGKQIPLCPGHNSNIECNGKPLLQPGIEKTLSINVHPDYRMSCSWYLLLLWRFPLSNDKFAYPCTDLQYLLFLIPTLCLLIWTPHLGLFCFAEVCYQRQEMASIPFGLGPPSYSKQKSKIALSDSHLLVFLSLCNLPPLNVGKPRDLLLTNRTWQR